MPKLFAVAVALGLIMLLQPVFIPQPLLAATQSCSSLGIEIKVNNVQKDFSKDQDTITISSTQPFGVTVYVPTKFNNPVDKYFVEILDDLVGDNKADTRNSPILGSSSTVEGHYNIYKWVFPSTGTTVVGAITGIKTSYKIAFKHIVNRLPGEDICYGPEKQIQTTSNLAANGEGCPITMSDNYNFRDNVTGTTSIKGIRGINYYYVIKKGDVSGQLPTDPNNPVDLSSGFSPDEYKSLQPVAGGGPTPIPTRLISAHGVYTAIVYAADEFSLLGKRRYTFACGYKVFTVSNDITSDQVPPVHPGRGSGGGPGGGGGGGGGAAQPRANAAGQPCQGGVVGINSALGCIPTDPAQFIQGLLRLATGIGGGIALLLMIFGAFQMMTSAGNPESLKNGSAQFTNAIVGLLFIIFSVLLLQIIGVNILNIPGFGS